MITEKTVIERLDGLVINWLSREETPAEKRALDKMYEGDFIDPTTKP